MELVLQQERGVSFEDIHVAIQDEKMIQKSKVLTEEQLEQEVISAFEAGHLKSISNVKAEIKRTTQIFEGVKQRDIS